LLCISYCQACFGSLSEIEQKVIKSIKAGHEI